MGQEGVGGVPHLPKSAGRDASVWADWRPSELPVLVLESRSTGRAMDHGSKAVRQYYVYEYMRRSCLYTVADECVNQRRDRVSVRREWF